ncbi:hypothetical protein [Crenalkalicoccus roseus]|uniref:hypothetical protein n=1 Tax=Crenalkalicoccus roseus TaxID=1485588 RepID=UPI001080F372|nr:hypothetical protein [Crenalkalicoccus roseus]
MRLHLPLIGLILLGAAGLAGCAPTPGTPEVQASACSSPHVRYRRGRPLTLTPYRQQGRECPGQPRLGTAGQGTPGAPDGRG